MRMLYLTIAVCLSASVAVLQPAGAASEQSAQEAVEQAFPHIDYTRGMALFRLLVQLQDGDAISISIGGTSAAFLIKGYDVVVTDRIEGPVGDGSRSVPLGTPIPLPGGPVKYLSAAVAPVNKQVNLDAYVSELERNNRRVASRTDHSISFYMRVNGSLLTLTDDATLLVRSAKALDSFVTVDQLADEAAEALSYLAHKGHDVSASTIADALREVRYYSEPPHSYKWVSFFGQPSNRRWMAARFSAEITVPELQVKEARFSQWYLNPRDVFYDIYRATPYVLLDGEEIIEPKLSERSYRRDVTALLKPGRHEIKLRMEDNTSNAIGSEFAIDMIVAPGFEDTFTVKPGDEDIVASRTSRPLAMIAGDFPALAEVVATPDAATTPDATATQ